MVNFFQLLKMNLDDFYLFHMQNYFLIDKIISMN